MGARQCAHAVQLIGLRQLTSVRTSVLLALAADVLPSLRPRNCVTDVSAYSPKVLAAVMTRVRFASTHVLQLAADGRGQLVTSPSCRS